MLDAWNAQVAAYVTDTHMSRLMKAQKMQARSFTPPSRLTAAHRGTSLCLITMSRLVVIVLIAIARAARAQDMSGHWTRTTCDVCPSLSALANPPPSVLGRDGARIPNVQRPVAVGLSV